MLSGAGEGSNLEPDAGETSTDVFTLSKVFEELESWETQLRSEPEFAKHLGSVQCNEDVTETPENAGSSTRSRKPTRGPSL
jgi:hypothetical protein